MQIAASIIRDIVYSAVAAGASLTDVVAAAALDLAELQTGEQLYDLPTVAAVWAAAVRIRRPAAGPARRRAGPF